MSAVFDNGVYVLGMNEYDQPYNTKLPIEEEKVLLCRTNQSGLAYCVTSSRMYITSYTYLTMIDITHDTLQHGTIQDIAVRDPHGPNNGKIYDVMLLMSNSTLLLARTRIDTTFSSPSTIIQWVVGTGCVGICTRGLDMYSIWNDGVKSHYISGSWMEDARPVTRSYSPSINLTGYKCSAAKVKGIGELVIWKDSTVLVVNLDFEHADYISIPNSLPVRYVSYSRGHVIILNIFGMITEVCVAKKSPIEFKTIQFERGYDKVCILQERNLALSWLCVRNGVTYVLRRPVGDVQSYPPSKREFGVKGRLMVTNIDDVLNE